MKRQTTTAIVCMTFFWIIPSVATAADLVLIRATATAPISANDLEAGRRAALAQLHRQCISQVLSPRLLSAEDYLKNQPQVERVFLANPQLYLERLLIDNEEIAGDGTSYQVTGSAFVRRNALRVALVANGMADIFSVGPAPTVMVLIRERFETRVTGTGVTESVLIKQLRAGRFKIVDPKQKKLLDMRNKVFAENNADAAAAVQAALSFNADYLLLGDAVVTSSGPLSGTELKARFANITLKIIESSSGQVLATEHKQASARHVDELTGGNWALEEAASSVAKDVISQFQTVLRQNLMIGAEVVLDVYGVAGEREIAQLEIAIQKVDGVKSLARRFAFSGAAQCEITFRGETPALAKAFSEIAVDGRPVDVIETLPRYLRVQMAGKAPPVPPNTEELFRAFLVEKHKHFDLEKQRLQDKELIAKINELAANTKINDEQKKQLFAARAQIEEKEQEVARRIQEQTKRKQEMELAQQDLKRLEKELELARADRQAAQAAQAKAAENARAAALASARSRAYTAACNYDNASSSSSMSAADAIQTYNSGMSLARNIRGLFGG